MNTESLSALLASLDHPDKPTIRAAVDELIQLAANEPQVRNALEHRLNESGHRNYWPVAYILGHLTQPSDSAVQKLLDALGHDEPDIRWAVALLLTRLARSASEVVILLLKLCRTGSVNQKRMAIYCLRDLGLSDSESLQAFIDALTDADATVRVAAVVSLKSRLDITEGAREILLRAYLNDKEIKVRNAAAVTLASFGAPSAEFLRALRRASESGEGQTKKAADAALDLLRERRPASTGSSRNR